MCCYCITGLYVLLLLLQNVSTVNERSKGNALRIKFRYIIYKFCKQKIA